jgi:hypothetical protein
MSAELVDRCDAGILQTIACGLLFKTPCSLEQNWSQVVSGQVPLQGLDLGNTLSAKILRATSLQTRKVIACLERDDEIAPENYELDIAAANLVRQLS